MPNTISVDPGIRGCGIVLWEGVRWSTDLVYPTKTFSLEPDIRESDWVNICAGMHETISKIIRENDVLKVYCEFPQYFGSDVGHAATTDGKIYKLACFVGMVMGTVFESGGTFHPIYVTDWKGQLSKEAVIKRIQRKNPDWQKHIPNIKTHCWDAYGIGLHAQGRF